MRYEPDDIAFQRAVLANPADTTLKLVYADWLQDCGDPRSEFVRRQVQLDGMIDLSSTSQAAKLLASLGADLDPAWVAFMTTLAQPFVPIRFQDAEPGHPFTEPVGHRGRVVVFESQYCTADAWDDGLLADLTFLAGIEWGECCYGAASPPVHGFVCELPARRDPLTGATVLKAVKAADFQSEHIATLDATDIPYPGYHPLTANDEVHTDFHGQKMFGREEDGAEDAGNHGLLKGYVTGKVWYALLHTGGRPCWIVTLLAVGRSPHGNRLVGAITSQMCHNLCD